MNYLLSFFLILLSCCLPYQESYADYENAIEDNDVVKNKFYPRNGRFQLNLIQGGLILNQSFIDTYLITASAGYHINEWSSVNIEAVIGINSDRYERTCIESFFDNTERASSAGAVSQCDPNGEYEPTTASPANETKPTNVDEGEWANYRAAKGPYHRKPAYMPVREIGQIITVNYQFTPVYGKALWFLSSVGYLDFFLNVGGGVTLSKFFPRKITTLCYQNHINSGSAEDECTIVPKDAGYKSGTSHINGWGKNGRPTPISQVSPTVALGLGSRFYFGRIMSGKSNNPSVEFLANLDLKNYTLYQADANNPEDGSFMNFFALWAGLGLIF